uniref:Uncharacterized protein n=1 Tax=Chromera velia CCMP2878 TaxID=1169474 RepID=A0A0G4I3G7_9ALVE|eukprot:Cvel_10579.t1-p1 / transcript=Cvel_10579.t1 / gene=Cvel_10579 / organism=Chromera_velia_CCMP2878 / gene_product=hypothetical protein / transcript_product=hypothetical protein / location=Cvel_scaffold641:27070-28220(-) / protein_length=167 / sequence_SO=supercontig / SO=protein_coding / is_pseudo=false
MQQAERSSNAPHGRRHGNLHVNWLAARLRAECLNVNHTITGVHLEKENLSVKYHVRSKNITQEFSLFREGQQRQGIAFHPNGMPADASVPSEAQAKTALRSLLAAQEIPKEAAEFGMKVAVTFADIVTKNWSESNSFTTDRILSEALSHARQAGLFVASGPPTGYRL